MNTVNVHIDFGPTSFKVGTLYASGEMGRHVFAYDPEFIATKLEISPLAMPLSAQTYPAPRNPDLYDLHPVFGDSMPDEWGRKVQDAEFAKIGIFEPSPLQRLAFIGMNGIGALRYYPAQQFKRGDDVVRLAQLRKATQLIIEGAVEEVSEELLKSGGSAGGARPKYLLDMNRNDPSRLRYTRAAPDDTYVPVVLKVPVRDNDQYQRIEYVYCRIAEKAGVNVPACHLITGAQSNQAYFAIERFDIMPDGKRLHVHSLAGIMGINFRETTPDSSTFLRVTDDITLNHEHVVEAFRRVVFNYIGSNKDDHAKNFSFTMDSSGEWSLAPAYDIAYSKGHNDMHAMRLNDKFRNAELHDFKRLARDFDITQWKDIVEKILSAFAKWDSLAEESGINEKYAYMIGSRIKANIGRIAKGLRAGGR
jgi:serine/threonine-protein kinase HipA